jgi:hypothetical protein
MTYKLSSRPYFVLDVPFIIGESRSRIPAAMLHLKRMLTDALITRVFPTFAPILAFVAALVISS